MAAHIAAVVAGAGQGAYTQPNYETFTPALPRASLKRKEPSLDTSTSTDAMHEQSTSLATPELTDSSVSEYDMPEPPVGCVGGLKAWIKTLFSRAL